MISYRLSHLNITKAVFYQLGYTKERKKSEYAKLRKKKMKAIIIKQPWASLIVHGIKDIENRTWSCCVLKDTVLFDKPIMNVKRKL
ncbi:hypothetical protein HMPREF9445_00159 [Bacteroides clarus YIT 12056]|uniref:Uncharacterized protein n=1 Tax=Bacteroides clarus YIT 12056 TaxID=762984 RepID=A0ABN0CSQ5_9BACE|nr:hypothetical protein HMPREF9445_00159 [Bacteroides clarus YIT 12056]